MDKYLAIMIGSLACSLNAYADTPGIYLDVSKGVILEQLAGNSFATSLLKTKSKFGIANLILGGSAQLDLQYWHGDSILTTTPVNYSTGEDVYLTQMTFDATTNITPWLTGYFSAAEYYLNSGSPDGKYFYIPNAFLLAGDLTANPFYALFGISKIPFGIFGGSGYWDSPLTSNYFNPTQAPQISVGYKRNELNLVATALQNQINYDYSAAYSLYYNHDTGDFQYHLGVGMLTNLKSNGTGRLSTPLKSASAAFSLGSVYDYNAGMTYKLVSTNIELNNGQNTIGINNGKPAAYSITATYAPVIAGTATTFGIAYSASVHFRDIETSLPGRDTVPYANAGLKKAIAANVYRPFFSSRVMTGLDVERSVTYDNLHTYTVTVDTILYL